MMLLLVAVVCYIAGALTGPYVYGKIVKNLK